MIGSQSSYPLKVSSDGLTDYQSELKFVITNKQQHRHYLIQRAVLSHGNHTMQHAFAYTQLLIDSYIPQRHGQTDRRLAMAVTHSA